MDTITPIGWSERLFSFAISCMSSSRLIAACAFSEKAFPSSVSFRFLPSRQKSSTPNSRSTDFTACAMFCRLVKHLLAAWVKLARFHYGQHEFQLLRFHAMLLFMMRLKRLLPYYLHRDVACQRPHDSCAPLGCRDGRSPWAPSWKTAAGWPCGWSWQISFACMRKSSATPEPCRPFYTRYGKDGNGNQLSSG